MPYHSSSRTTLPPERSSRIAHMSVLDNPFIQELNLRLKPIEIKPSILEGEWIDIPTTGSPIQHACAIDGSLIEVEVYSGAKVAFVTVASVDIPFVTTPALPTHPLALRDVLGELTVRVSTMIPLENISLDNSESQYETTLRLIFETLQEHPDLLETLHWLACESWRGNGVEVRDFRCPHCMEMLIVPTEMSIGRCECCGKTVYLSDWLGLHRILLEGSPKRNFASSLMQLLEMLMLFTRIRILWQHDRALLQDTLFVKDGPLALYGQLRVLVPVIRRFFRESAMAGIRIGLVGQEKTGMAVNHLAWLQRYARLRDNTLYVPDNQYVSERIYGRSHTATSHVGRDHLYGARVLVNYNPKRVMVISLPIGGFTPVPLVSDLYRFEDVLATLPTLHSHSHENALWPIEIAHRACSLGHYPAMDVLARFIESGAERIESRDRIT